MPELYETYWPWLADFCADLTHDRSSGEDMAQETFLRAMQNYHILMGLTDRQKRAWLKRTARNLWIDQLRRDRRADGEVPEQPYTEDFDRGMVAALCASLPEEERTIFTLRYFAGYNATELGEMFGLPPSTVRARLKSARGKLKRYYFEE